MTSTQPETGLKAAQLAMARYLREPQLNPPPPAIEPRRLQVYLDLIYNNIEGFISGGFPVLRSLYEEAEWHSLVRAFIDGHRCHTPYFLEISQEFLTFLMERHERRDCDPPFMLELAHYEWVELALDISQEALPAPVSEQEPLQMVPWLSPLAWSLAYEYPVHQIGPGFRPEKSADPVYLVVYRNRQEEVQFIELNAATARLLELIRANETADGMEILLQLAAELGLAEAAVLDFGSVQIQQFLDLGVIVSAPAKG